MVEVSSLTTTILEELVLPTYYSNMLLKKRRICLNKLQRSSSWNNDGHLQTIFGFPLSQHQYHTLKLYTILFTPNNRLNLEHVTSPLKKKVITHSETLIAKVEYADEITHLEEIRGVGEEEKTIG